MKGLVVEKQARCRVVLTPTGEYRKVYGARGEVGQEITAGAYFRVPKAAVLTAAVLLVVFILSLALPAKLRQDPVYAYITVDINPSAEFAINAEYKVMSVHPYNLEAEDILTGLNCKGKEIDSVLAEFTQSALSRGYLSGSDSGDGENSVVVSFYSSVQTKDAETGETLLERVAKAQREVLKQSGTQADIRTVVVDAETRKEAEQLGVSAGRLADTRRKEEEGKNSSKEPDPAGQNGSGGDAGKAGMGITTQFTESEKAVSEQTGEGSEKGNGGKDGESPDSKGKISNEEKAKVSKESVTGTGKKNSGGSMVGTEKKNNGGNTVETEKRNGEGAKETEKNSSESEKEAEKGNSGNAVEMGKKNSNENAEKDGRKCNTGNRKEKTGREKGEPCRSRKEPKGWKAPHKGNHGGNGTVTDPHRRKNQTKTSPDGSGNGLPCGSKPNGKETEQGNKTGQKIKGEGERPHKEGAAAERGHGRPPRGRK